MMKLQSVIFNMKRDKRALYYKPLALLLTVDLIDNGDIDPKQDFPPELILNKFSEAMLHFDKSRKQRGHMPVWHLTTDNFWTLYKDKEKVAGQGISRLNPKSNKRLNELVDEVRLNLEFWHVEKKREEIYKASIELLRSDFSKKGETASQVIANLFIDNDNKPPRSLVTHERIIRNNKLTREIKEIYDDRCQICRVDLPVPKPHEKYSEGAHIKPLGRPHNGDDVLGNILCLCPNHHVQFDYGYITINDDFSIISKDCLYNSKILKVKPSKHKIDLEMIRYHRDNIYSH